MRAPSRASIALLAALLVGAGFDLESIFHVRGDWFQELRAHELSLVEASGRCEKSPHWDSGRSEHHEACVACMVSAAALAAPANVAEATPPPYCSARRVAPAPPDLVGSRFAAPGGRSPPAALLRLA